MENVEVRQAAKSAGVHLWQIAEALGVRDSDFSRMLRHELPADKKAAALAAIRKFEVGGDSCG